MSERRILARIENDENRFQEIAIDLEAHSFRSFSGFVCTMQLSLRRPSLPEGSTASTSDGNIESGYDFIIDTLNSIIDQTYKNWRLVLIDDN